MMQRGSEGSRRFFYTICPVSAFPFVVMVKAILALKLNEILKEKQNVEFYVFIPE